MKAILASVVLLFCSYLSAQEYQISGVVQLATGDRISNVTVLLTVSGETSFLKAGITNDEGKFSFSNVKPGNYTISVSYLGFENFTSEIISVKDASITLATFTLQEKSETLNEVVLVKKKPVIQVLADKTVFNVESSLNSTGSSGFELLRKAPGIVIDNNDNLIVEGKSGVLIYIDGKQSFLSGTDLINYLKTLQANDIESIEIITQPSSKFDAAGNAGIVNIRLKKNKNFGTNGSVSTGLNIGKYATTLNSLSLNNRNKKSNIYGNYSNQFGRNYGFMNFYRVQNNTVFDSETTSIYEANVNNVKIGYDYYANSKNTFGIALSSNFNNNFNDSDTRTPIRPLNSSINDSILVASSNSHNRSYNLYSNLNYKYQDTTGVSLNMDLDFGKYNSYRENYQPNYYYDSTETIILNSIISSQETPVDISIATFKTDYEQNFLKGKIGVGIKSSIVETDNIFDFYDIVDDEPTLNLNRSNQFIYEEIINAGYINYNRNFKKINFQMGLRIENTNSDGRLISDQDIENEEVKRNYTDFFPSAGLTFQMNEKNSFALIYSRRIERPSYQSLNPFEYQLDELSYRKGNPFLNPQYTNNIKLAHTFKYKYTTTISYSYINDFFAQVTQADGESKSFITTRNVADQEIINLGLSYPFNLKEWWGVYLSVNAFRSKYIATDPDFVSLTQETVSFYGQNNFTLPKGFNLEVSGWFSSPSVWGGTYQTDSLGSLDLALQKKFLSDKLTARIAFTDVLYTSPWTGSTEFANVSINGNGGNDSRQIRFNISYNFGNDAVKNSRARNTGLEEEKNRLGGS